MFKKNHVFVLLVIIAFVSCNVENKKNEPALESIVADDMKNRISVLASDDFQRRAPVTIGEEKTINHLAEQFKQIGSKPANRDSYFQEVALMKLTADASMKLDISDGERNLSLVFSDDFIGGTPQISEFIQIDNSDIIIVLFYIFIQVLPFYLPFPVMRKLI